MINYPKYTPVAITGAATTLVATGNSLLHNIVVTGGTTGTIKIYDALTATGTPVYDFDTTNTLQVFNMDSTFSKGITIVTSAATKLTANYLQ